MGRKGESRTTKKMMEMVVVVALILSMQWQQASAGVGFKTCFITCLLSCMFEGGGTDTIICMGRCLSDCAKSEEPPHDHQSSLSKSDYCTVGCSIDHCAKLGHDADKVEACVKNCDKSTCSAKLPLN